jgi:capsular polysaccharide biosynthesis protein
MEIRDYLRAIRRILPLLIILPIVAAAVTGFFLEGQPSKYEADATVVVPAISGNGTSQSAAAQYVDTFKDVLVSQPVVVAVSQKYKISQADLLAGLSADTVTASSNIIHVTLIGQKGQNLAGAVREATVESMDWIAQPSVIQAQDELSVSQTLLDTANANIFNWEATTGNVEPQSKYNGAQQTLSNDEQLLQEFILDNSPAHAAAERVSITNQTKLVTTLGQQLQQYQSYSNALSAALASHNHARQVYTTAQALVATDHAPSTVSVAGVVRLSKLSDVIKFAAIAFALALLMMLGLILILELMRSSRRPAAVAVATEQGAFAWQAAPPEPAAAATSSATGGDEARDPWRATPEPMSSAAVADGNGNGNGNGHANGNGNGHGDAPGAATDPERAERGLLRRR